MENPQFIKNPQRFILTGTPGSGKTSVILKLEKSGYSVIPEAATDVIAAQQTKGIERPWEAPDFIDQIVLVQKDRQQKALGDLQFYDRSPFCTYALGQYLALSQKTKFVPSPTLLAEIDRCFARNVYQNPVFFFENLGFIQTTQARQISYEEALVFEQIHEDVYRYFGFEVIRVPKGAVEERSQHVLQEVHNRTPPVSAIEGRQ